MKSIIITSLLVTMTQAMSYSQKISLLDNIGFQVRKSLKATTFSGIDFEKGISKGNKGLYFEVNKQFIQKVGMGYRNQSVGLAYRNAGIAISEGNYAGTTIDMTTVEVPVTLGFYLFCPACGIFTMIPVGFNIGGYVGVPLSYEAKIYDKSKPNISPYPYNNQYEKPKATFGITASATLNFRIEKIGVFRLLYGFNSNLTGIFKSKDDNIVLPYEVNTGLGSQFIGLEYVIGGKYIETLEIFSR